MATTLSTLRRYVRQRLLEYYALVTPGSPLVSPQGTTGASTWSYKITATNGVGETEVSQAGSTATGNATLTGSNFNRLTWTAVPFATGYKVYRTSVATSPTTTGLIGSPSSPTFDDTGIAGDSATPPEVNTSGLSAAFWTEDELLQIMILGARDLWRAIVDLHQGHFTTIDATNVSLTASSSTLTGVPVDCFRVLSLEPRDLSQSASTRNVTFRPMPYQSRQFMEARASSSFSPSEGGVIYYDILNAGSPVAAPSIVIAPQISSAMNCRLVYTNTLAALTESSNNPIPGESDNALIAWTTAWARAKDREDRMPDPSWLAPYATDKNALLVALTPRQEQEPEVVEDFFSEYWGY